MLNWTIAAAVLAVAVVAGRALLTEASPGTVSVPLAFAGGTVVAALADTFMPEAYEKGGSAAALATAAGCALANSRSRTATTGATKITSTAYWQP